VSLHAKQQIGGKKVGMFIQSTLAWQQKVVGGQYHVPAALSQGRRPGTDSTGVWVSLGASVNGSGKSHPPPGFEPRIVISTALSD
jgi:hypothetical protein